MAIDFRVEHRHPYSVVRVDGEPTLGEFLDFVQRLGLESVAWTRGRVLVDLRSVRTLKSLSEHQAIGQAVGRHLGHLLYVASVVPADRLTRGSETTARSAGVNLAVFTNEREAIEWLTTSA